nr:acyl-CoA dehydrogenase family protein [uncultured Rhodococcus sp.]
MSTTTIIGEPVRNHAGPPTRDVDAVLESGYSSMRAPIGESVLVAGPLLRSVNQAVPEGLSTIGVADSTSLVVRYTQPNVDSTVGPLGAEGVGSSITVTGTVARVPFADSADAVLVLVETPGGPVVFVAPDDVRSLDTGTDLAGNPLSTLMFDGVEIESPAPVSRQMVADVRVRLALVHAVLIAGAAQRCAEMTVAHTSTRKQFGRTLDHFQAVKQNVALLLQEVALVRGVVRLALRHLDAAGSEPLSAAGRTAATAAVVQASVSAGEIARLSHQLHGAVGFTELSDLHLYTTRLWASRDAIGGGWNSGLGASALAAGADGVWNLVTACTEGLNR